MAPVHYLKTRLINKTGQRIGFDVDGGIFPLQVLAAGKSGSVSLSLIIKLCRERGSADWLIRILINDRFHGMCLHPRHHILKMTRIVFRYKWRDDDSCVLIAEGVAETCVNRVFGCCVKLGWEKRIYVQIAEADCTWRIIRSSQHRNVVGPSVINENNQPLRQDGCGVAAGGRSSHENSNAAVETRKRLYRLLSLERRDMFIRFVLFVLAFLLVGSVHVVLYN